jgi:hypothetical protein
MNVTSLSHFGAGECCRPFSGTKRAVGPHALASLIGARLGLCGPEKAALTTIPGRQRELRAAGTF